MSEAVAPTAGRRGGAARLAAATAALLLGLVLLAAPQRMAGPLLHTLVCQRADAQLAASLARNSVSFGALSGLKGVLATIEGSSVGVGFQLELGDLVQPAYDYLDLVWRAFLAALALLGFFELIFQAGLLQIGLSLLGAGGVLWGAALFLARQHEAAEGGIGGSARARLARGTRQVGRRLLGLGFAVAYGLPLALLASELVTRHYLEPLRAKNAAQLEAAGAPLAGSVERLRALRERVSILEPGRSLEEISREARAVAEQASDAVWARARVFSATVLILAVELLLLPFLSAWLAVALLRSAARGFGSSSGGLPWR